MAIIQTERNHVYAYEALDRDHWVETLVGNRRLLVQPIEQYQQAVDWAVSMADQFDPPLHVLPIDVADYGTLYRAQIERQLVGMTPEERHGLRQEMVATLAHVMRDCDDHAVRADAYDVLVKMKVVRC